MVLSAYEKERIKKMEKNKQQLNELGLGLINKKSIVKAVKKPVVKVAVEKTYSLRERPSKTIVPTIITNVKNTRRKSKQAKKVEKLQNVIVPDSMEIVQIQEAKKSFFFSLTSRELSMNLESFKSWIGKCIVPTGKQVIMEGLCKDPSTRPKFNMYSGLQTWKNGQVLFINLDESSEYDNVFKKVPDGRVYVTWYAPKRMGQSSSTVDRLSSATHGDFDLASYLGNHDLENMNSLETTLLFCRLGKGCYVCCGRLGYLYHDMEDSENDMPFYFQLLDYEQLNWQVLDAYFMQE